MNITNTDITRDFPIAEMKTSEILKNAQACTASDYICIKIQQTATVEDYRRVESLISSALHTQDDPFTTFIGWLLARCGENGETKLNFPLTGKRIPQTLIRAIVVASHTGGGYDGARTEIRRKWLNAMIAHFTQMGD